MYTGTLISDLMATVEQAEQRAEQVAMERELHSIFTMQIPLAQNEKVYMGAA